jgi:hypothetical protein
MDITHTLVNRDIAREISRQRTEQTRGDTYILVSKGQQAANEINKWQDSHPSKQSDRDQQTVNITNKKHHPQAGKRRQSERGHQTMKRMNEGWHSQAGE